MTETEMQMSNDWTPTAQDALRLPMRLSERRVLLMALDLLALNGALLAALALRPAYAFDPELVIRCTLWFLVLSAMWFPLGSAIAASVSPRGAARVDWASHSSPIG